MISGRAVVAVILMAFCEPWLRGGTIESPVTTSVQLFSVEKGSNVLCRSGDLLAVPRCGAGCGDRHAVMVPWIFRGGSAELDLALAPEISWEINVGGKGCWAPPLVVAAGTSGETRTAFVWSAATISGNFIMKKGDQPPKELHATVQAKDPQGMGAAIPETSLDCSVDGFHWRCALPATAGDLRLAADEFVPLYLWGFDAPAGGTKTLDIALVRGASVSGLVALADRRATPEGVDVELRPAGYASTASDERRMTARSRTTKANSRGFFQFTTVGEGAYEVTATKKGWSRAARPVRVGGAKESDVGLLTLPPLARFEVVIDPALDVKGRPWRVVLDRDSIPMQPLAPLADRKAASDGTWSHDGVEAGKYRLDVYDGDGAAFEHIIVDIQPKGAPLRLHMDAVVGRGVLRAGHEPLPATLRFIQDRGSGDVNLASGDDGSFAGTFPAAGNYSVEITPRDTEQRLRTKAAVRPNADGVVQLDIDLPGGLVVGSVVAEDGRPVAGSVRLYGDNRSVTTRTKEDGSFRLIGIEPGDVMLNARARNVGDSGPVSHNVAEGASEPVTLTLHPNTSLTMWVASPAGAPVASAIVRYTIMNLQREVITGPDGDVHFDVPRGVDAVSIVVVAAGFPSRMMKLPIAPDMDVNPQVVLGSTAATLIVQLGSTPPWPTVQPGNGPDAGVHWLPELFSSPLGGPTFTNKTSRGFEFEVEPGIYTLCPGQTVSSKCIQKMLAPGTETAVDVRFWSEETR